MVEDLERRIILASITRTQSLVTQDVVELAAHTSTLSNFQYSENQALRQVFEAESVPLRSGVTLLYSLLAVTSNQLENSRKNIQDRFVYVIIERLVDDFIEGVDRIQKRLTDEHQTVPEEASVAFRYLLARPWTARTGQEFLSLAEFLKPYANERLSQK